MNPVTRKILLATYASAAMLAEGMMKAAVEPTVRNKIALRLAAIDQEMAEVRDTLELTV